MHGCARERQIPPVAVKLDMLPEPTANWSYRHPAGVTPQVVGGCPALTTPQGGRVLVGRSVLDLWQAAAGRSCNETLEWSVAKGASAVEAACTLACLASAGMLERASLPPQTKSALPVSNPKPGSRRVSAVIVGYNSREWLPGCLESLAAQTYPAHEVIVVDNGSSDGTADWLSAAYPDVRLIRLSGGSFAAAVNTGITAATGDDYLILNPDVVLEATALAWMLRACVSESRCAAAAAKLRFMWAPAFLNGLGNFVGAAGYGTDSALGHLDLGQFDDWDDLPSACFAATLLAGDAVQKVGLLDPGFPMYYEDSEWCYRARLLGYRIRAAPQAVVYHAFSGRVPTGSDTGLAPLKLRWVTYGRLRFITRVLGEAQLARFLNRYRLEDRLRALPAVFAGKTDLRRAYRLGWDDYQAALPEILEQRAELQLRRQIDPDALFATQRRVPPPLMRRGLPLLTGEVIRTHYAGWLLGPARDRFPETAALPEQTGLPARSPLARAAQVARDEGPDALLHRTAKSILWRLQSDV